MKRPELSTICSDWMEERFEHGILQVTSLPPRRGAAQVFQLLDSTKAYIDQVSFSGRAAMGFFDPFLPEDLPLAIDGFVAIGRREAGRKTHDFAKQVQSMKHSIFGTTIRKGTKHSLDRLSTMHRGSGTLVPPIFATRASRSSLGVLPLPIMNKMIKLNPVCET